MIGRDDSTTGSPSNRANPTRSFGDSSSTSNASASDPAKSSQISAPSLSLPKGGGAIRGIGEKFAANPVTGTGSMSVPIATSPGRSGFGPQLSLSYDSGAGNGPFGFGWNLSIPSITRKTDKGLPQYRDAEESDEFILSGAEDLVPVLEANGLRHKDDSSVPGFIIYRYRPRIEGLFARIERWTNQATGDIHWRSITPNNITTIYGKTAESRIHDPADPLRVFSWLLCESYDDKGNALLYEYAEEDDKNIDRSQVNERNRVRTANRYVKRIKYGNRVSRLKQPDLTQAEWLFEVVFDYDEAHYEELSLDPAIPPAAQQRFSLATASTGAPWPVRPDPFSTHRAGFEVRTYRRCRRVLMFHNFEELGPEPCLVRSTEFDFDDLDYTQTQTIEMELAHPGSTRFASFIRGVTQSGFVRDETQPLVDRNGVSYVTYLKKSLPPLEFEYTKATIQETIRKLEGSSVENLPVGLDGANYQWIDLDGEGLNGILTDQAGAWFYKRNRGGGTFGPMETVAAKPSLAALGSGRQQLMDLAGNGQLDLVALAGPTTGFYERTQEKEWETFRTFRSLPNIAWEEPNLRFIDLNGDGHADVFMTEDQVFTWHHSLAEEGFGPAQRVRQPLDEEQGPCLVLDDSTQSIYLADMCGDGLTDLVRIRNGEICYWPNQGYGRFGPKVTMDNAPRFDHPDQFNHQRLRLADINGSGTIDIIYVGRQDIQLFFNQSGNRWSGPRGLTQFPKVDNLSSVTTADILGNGTACLVWSSPLPGDAQRPLRYIDLMGGHKPHLMIKTINNLGTETRVHYAPSTKFYLADQLAGKPWITKLPFPVHVVEKIESFDRISGNLFVTRHTYHHGFFDGVEREFRGFGMVEQTDTEEFAALNAGQAVPVGTNIEASSHVPPIRTRTWFHTGAYLDRRHISDFFAGLIEDNDPGEYYREPGLTDAQARQRLLPDTVLPFGLTAEEEREACRALKGSILRQEVYALDGTDKESHPYTVTEQNFAIRHVQGKAGNCHAVFFAHPREAITYQYERNPADPRTAHALTLEVDAFGNVRKEAAVGYGRRQPDPNLEPRDQAKQGQIFITYTENDVTNAVEEVENYRTPLPCESRTYELTGYTPTGPDGRFQFSDFVRPDPTDSDGFKQVHQFDQEIPYHEQSNVGQRERRLIEQVRTVYRQNDLTGPLLLGQLKSLALPFESYQLVFTPGLVTSVYESRVTDDMLEIDGRYVHSEGDTNWWISSGRVFFSPGTEDTPTEELAHAQAHFFLPNRFRDPFHTDQIRTESFVTYDAYDLLMLETRDALDNRVTVGERLSTGDHDPDKPGHDYRVLQPKLMMDPNRNRAIVAFDALGMVVGTAVMGKPEESLGDSLEGFVPDLTEAQIRAHIENPRNNPHGILKRATTRLVYDLFAYHRTKDHTDPQPATVYAMARETHDADLERNQQTKIQHSFSYSDGFGRAIQTKIQAEPGPVPKRDPLTGRILIVNGEPDMTQNPHDPRWVGSGWTVLNNKGKPVRQYEPFFTDTHRFEFDVRIGVSPVLFYDSAERVVATLHPNQTFEKVVFDHWHQQTWDVNDTVLIADPATDPHLGNFFARLPPAEYLPTWHTQRVGGARGGEEQSAAQKAADHAHTPSEVYVDSLGRPFLTIADNAASGKFLSRVELDIEGNQRAVIDAKNRTVMHYHYDMLGNQIRQDSMEAGRRWGLANIAGNPIYQFDSRNHRIRMQYDRLQRPTEQFMQEEIGTELLVERIIYGETLGPTQSETNNHRGQVFQQLDGAGIVTAEEYDFKGNLFRSIRQLAEDYKTTPDWTNAPALEQETFPTSTTYDALNRPLTLTTPDTSIVRPTYNEANLLERLEVDLQGGSSATTFVENIDYDAKGQRKAIEYGNEVRTTYEYERETFRLKKLQTFRGQQKFQDLSYTYDPVGNITAIRDVAQQTIYFNNAVVEPHATYTYDAIYQLIHSTGREHIGQVSAPQTTWDEGFRTNLPHPGDGQAMRLYTEDYEYDEVGNFLRLIHQAANGNWRREYKYQESSLLEPVIKQNNRLTRTEVGNTIEPYFHDEHGNMTGMPHLSLMQWDYRDQLQVTSKQVDNNGTPETTFYVYDGGGQRVRKVTERQAPAGQVPTRIKERLYLGGFEIFREYANDGNSVTLVRETLHIMDDKERIALVETRTKGNEPGVPQQLIRYQFGNHLGSASLELDDQAQIISYEEYYPYGSTSYQAVRSQIRTPKRYRFTGMERDEESGLAYHGARYYAPWLGRWTGADPVGLAEGANLFRYSRNIPTGRIDPTGGKSEDFLIEVYQIDITLSGHASPLGSAASNRKLSSDRVNRSLELLLSSFANLSFGVDSSDENTAHRVTTEAHGEQETSKVAGGDPNANDQSMRRVDVKVGINRFVVGHVPSSRSRNVEEDTASNSFRFDIAMTTNFEFSNKVFGAKTQLNIITITNKKTGEHADFLLHSLGVTAGKGPSLKGLKMPEEVKKILDMVSGGATISVVSLGGDFTTSSAHYLSDFSNRFVSIQEIGLDLLIANLSVQNVSIFGIKYLIPSAGADVGFEWGGGPEGSVTGGFMHSAGRIPPDTRKVTEYYTHKEYVDSPTKTDEFEFSVFFETGSAEPYDIGKQLLLGLGNKILNVWQ